MERKNEKKIALTGDRPTGGLHLGHYIGSLLNRVKIQDEYSQYIMIADLQAMTDNADNPEKIIANVYEVAADYLSVGIDPEKTTIFIQSKIQELSELTIYYMNLVTLARLERNPTVKTEIQQKNYDNDIPAGFLCYPISQAADITIFKADIVPVGNDQIPMIEQTNEIVRKFNRIYNTNFLKETKAVLSNTPRLVGIDGKAKASKSLNNAIFLSDTKEEVKRKVFLMYTDPNHIKISDPGQIDGNVVFSYLDAFHSNKEEVEFLKSHYRKGGLGDTTIKSILNNTLQSILDPIRERRASINMEFLKDVVIKGTERARIVANHTISEVRAALGINYW